MEDGGRRAEGGGWRTEWVSVVGGGRQSSCGRRLVLTTGQSACRSRHSGARLRGEAGHRWPPSLTARPKNDRHPPTAAAMAGDRANGHRPIGPAAKAILL